MIGGPRRVVVAAELLAGRAGASELLGSQTVPIEYQFTFIDSTATVRFAFGRPRLTRRPFYLGAGLGASKRIDVSVTQGSRTLKLANFTAVPALLTGGLDYRRLLLEARVQLDFDGFDPSPVTTDGGTKHFRSIMVMVGYRLK